MRDRPMHCTGPFLASIFWFAVVSSAHALSLQVSVTPTNLDTHGYTFSVLTNATNEGVAFHVTIANKQYDIYPRSSADVQTVIHREHGMESSITPVVPAIPIVLKKKKRIWTADFTVPRKLLKDPNAHFVFSASGPSTVNGQVIPPSVTFYELRLQDFAKAKH